MDNNKISEEDLDREFHEENAQQVENQMMSEGVAPDNEMEDIVEAEELERESSPESRHSIWVPLALIALGIVGLVAIFWLID